MTFVLYEGNREPSVTTQIQSNSVPVDLTAATVGFRMRPRNSTTLKVNAGATVTNAAQGLVRYDWGATDTDTPGAYFAWFTVTTGGRQQDTPEFEVEVREHAGSTGANLCTIDDVRRVLQTTVGDIGQDDEIDGLIPAASAAIMRRCEREFAPATDGATRTVQHYGGRRFIPIPWDLRAVTSVVLPDQWGAGAVTLTANTDYAVSPLNGDGVLEWIEIPRCAYGRGWWSDGLIRITGNWGFPSVPVDVTQAAAVTVASWLDRGTSSLAHLAEAEFDSTPETGANYGIPTGAYHLLKPFIRFALA